MATLRSEMDGNPERPLANDHQTTNPNHKLHETMAATQRDIFGGAIQVSMPPQFFDLSDVRQVPDNQECWQDESFRLLVIEVMERQQHVSDANAASFFFNDLADENGSRHIGSSFMAVESQSGEEIAPGAVWCSGRGIQKVRMGEEVDVFGNPREQEERYILVEMSVLRLPSVSSDILISLSTPNEQNPQDVGPSNEFSEVVSSFTIRDWSLFATSASQ